MKIPQLYRDAKINSSIKIDVGKSWYLCGAVGAGKTYFGYAAMQSLTKENPLPPVRLINLPVTFNEISYADFDTKYRTIELLRKCRRLIIDDLGLENRKMGNVLYDIVNHRYENDLYTGVISNHTIKSIYEDLDYDYRIVSRIKGLVGSNVYFMDPKKYGDRRVHG